MPDDFDDEFDDESNVVPDKPAHTSDGKSRPNEPTAYDVTAAEVQSFVDRMTNLDEQMADLRDDKKKLYAELKARGFDRKAFDATMKVIRIRQDKSKVEAKLEMRAIASLYLTALGQDDFEDLL